MTDRKKTLITSALPYINGIKHLGNLAGSLLPADIHARRNQIPTHLRTTKTVEKIRAKPAKVAGSSMACGRLAGHYLSSTASNRS
jgi:hypothetical protein